MKTLEEIKKNIKEEIVNIEEIVISDCMKERDILIKVIIKNMFYPCICDCLTEKINSIGYVILPKSSNEIELMFRILKKDIVFD